METYSCIRPIKFIDSILENYGVAKLKGNTCVQVNHLPDKEEIPDPAALKALQGHRASSTG